MCPSGWDLAQRDGGVINLDSFQTGKAISPFPEGLITSDADHEWRRVTTSSRDPLCASRICQATSCPSFKPDVSSVHFSHSRLLQQVRSEMGSCWRCGIRYRRRCDSGCFFWSSRGLVYRSTCRGFVHLVFLLSRSLAKSGRGSTDSRLIGFELAPPPQSTRSMSPKTLPALYVDCLLASSALYRYRRDDCFLDQLRGSACTIQALPNIIPLTIQGLPAVSCSLAS